MTKIMSIPHDAEARLRMLKETVSQTKETNPKAISSRKTPTLARRGRSTLSR